MINLNGRGKPRLGIRANFFNGRNNEALEGLAKDIVEYPTPQISEKEKNCSYR